MSSDDENGGAPEPQEGPDQVERLNKSLLLAFKSHLEKGDLAHKIPKNESLDDSDDDEKWAAVDDGPEDEAARREVMGMLRAFVQQKLDEADGAQGQGDEKKEEVIQKTDEKSS